MARATFPEGILPFGREITARFQRGMDQMLRTAMALTARQIGISRGLTQGGMEDFAALAGVRSPDGLMQARTDVARRQPDGAVAALQAMAADLTKSLGETARFVWRASKWH